MRIRTAIRLALLAVVACSVAPLLLYSTALFFGATIERWLLIGLTRYGGVELDHFGCNSIDSALLKRHRKIKNVAITFVQGYDEVVFELFSNSFHAHNSNKEDATVLLVSTPQAACFDYCVKFVPCTTPACLRAQLERPDNVFLVDAQFCEHRFPFWAKPHLKRFLIIQQWLEQNLQYEKVMLSDGRDVYFQGNPFEHMTEDGVYAWYEPTPFQADSRFNQAWIRDCYGQAYLQQLLAKVQKVICCGVTMGTAAQLRVYMTFYVREMDALLKQRTAGSNDWCVHGMDSAAHYRVLLELLPKHGVSVLLLDDKASFVRHQAATAIDPGGLLVAQIGHLGSKGGGPPWAVVHQADRNVEFWREVEREYAPSATAALDMDRDRDS